VNRIRNFFRTREMRKLLRDRLTIFAMIAIGAYLATGIAIMCGAITAETCDQVVGPNKLNGFYREELPERRYDIATTKFLQAVQTALGQEDPQAALEQVQLGRVRVADKSPEELQTIVDQIIGLRDELNQSENLDEDPAMMPKLAEMEAKVEQLKKPLTGMNGFLHNASLWLGTDAQGRSIFFRGLYSIKIALQIGLVTATFSVLLGAFLGAAAGYLGGWVDSVIVWIYTTFSSIPNLVLLVVIAYAFTDFDLQKRVPAFMSSWVEGIDIKNSLLPVYIAFGATFWIGTCRVIRGETMKLKEMEYIHAARTAGFSSFHILLRHIIPNTAHLMLINFSLLLIGAIKSEVILSFLGLGVKGQPSWGIMIRDAGNNGDVVTGFFWEIGTATVLMFGLVLAFNILSDALQDAFDPKHV
jgi:peptide/nickel transport system permease protein